MFVAKVTGAIVSTQKVDTMIGQKLLVVETLGAGVGDMVLITQGSSARFTPETSKLPIDCVIIGIVDTVHIEKNNVYKRQ